MQDCFAFRDLFPGSARDRALLAAFLEANALRYEEDLEGGIGAFDDEELVACGCFSGNILKCFAVSPEARGNNVLGALLSRLVTLLVQRGVHRLGVYTTPKNSAFFAASGFYPVCQTEHVAYLENVPNGIAEFAAAIRPADAGKEAGAIVMNCNPFTRGHRYLVEYAVERSELVYIFVVEENRSVFPFAVRLQLVREGVADLPQVRVLASGRYMISAATFPTYFLKQHSDFATIQAEFDATLFAQAVAPAFDIRRRYAGNEPGCPLTRQYNHTLCAVLPLHGIEFEEIPRLAEQGEAISASRVREQIRARGVTDSLSTLVPPGTLAFLRSPEAEPVIRSIRGG
jgi:[citrate (pro-3S)-lyase] ligase